jgi:hypothetical protein
MPWNLSSAGRSEAYARGTDSILTRRILEKAPEMSLNGGYGEEVSQQWANLTAPPNVERQQPRRVQKLAKLPARPAKAFDPDRLLHPWQRQMNAMKKKLLGQEGGEDDYAGEDEQGDYEDEVEDVPVPVPVPARQQLQQQKQQTAQRAAPEQRLQPIATSSSAPSFNSRSQAASLPPSDGPKTGLRQLQSINSSWGDSEPQAAPSPNKSFKNALGFPTDSSVRSSAAVERVGNALAEGLSQSSDSTAFEQQGKPPAHPRSKSAAAAQGNSSGGEESESDDDEEIGWSPFAVR